MRHRRRRRTTAHGAVCAPHQEILGILQPYHAGERELERERQRAQISVERGAVMVEARAAMHNKTKSTRDAKIRAKRKDVGLAGASSDLAQKSYKNKYNNSSVEFYKEQRIHRMRTPLPSRHAAAVKGDDGAPLMDGAQAWSRRGDNDWMYDPPSEGNGKLARVSG